MRHCIGIGFGLIRRLDVLAEISSARRLNRNTPGLLSLVVKKRHNWSVACVIGCVVDVREKFIAATAECFVVCARTRGCENI